jgi:hypothetical protein
MTMPVLVGAFSKNGFVLFIAPGRVIKFVGRIKMFGSCQVNHALLFVSSQHWAEEMMNTVISPSSFSYAGQAGGKGK